MSASLSGVVMSTDGSPVSGAAVMIIAAPQPVPDIAIISDSHGHFSLEDCPAGYYVLEVISRSGTGRVEIELFDFSMTEIMINLTATTNSKHSTDSPVPDIGTLLAPTAPGQAPEPYVVSEYDPDEALESPSDESTSTPTAKKPAKRKRASSKRVAKPATPKQKLTTRKRKPKQKPKSD